MDTNSNIPVHKTVVKVEWPNITEGGFGWNGEFTREEWRKACLDNFVAGKNNFAAWQNSWKDQINKYLPKVSLIATLTYDDGTHGNILGESYDESLPFALDFVGCTFEEDVKASDYLFVQSVCFNSAIFQKSMNFTNAKFMGKTDFSSVVCFRNTTFSSTEFADDVNFSSMKFTGVANFDNSRFTGIVNLSRAKFMGDANFSNARFARYAFFSSVSFARYADFNNVTFTGSAYFNSATFNKNTNFFKIKFISQCRFDNEKDGETKVWSRETQFLGAVNFENAEIQNVGHFERVQFRGRIPNFLGVNNAQTLLMFSGDEYFNKKDTTEEAVKRIGQLKRLADEQGQTDQALMFNAFELNAKAKQPDASSLFKLFTWLYEKISNYGRSFGRPIATYLGLISITYILALIAAANNSTQDCKGELWRVLSDWKNNGAPSCLSAELPEDKLRLNGYRAALEYTTYRAAGILDFSDNDKQTVAVSKRLFNADVEPTWMRFWGIFKAIASAALLFLAALGLRNKYRIK